MLFNPAIKFELERILLKLDVIVAFKLFINCVFDEILLKFVLIKLVLELIFLKLVVIVEFKLFIQCVFDEILLKFVFEVIVRLPNKNVFDETLTKLLAIVAVLFIIKYAFELILFDNTLTSVLLHD